MMLADSNIIIYSIEPQYLALREFLLKEEPAYSEISRVEVLGFHKLLQPQKKIFEELFKFLTPLDVTPTIVSQAIALRQQRKMALGDALIAATALVHNLTLVTRNTGDFAWISGIKLLDPLANSAGSAS